MLEEAFGAEQERARKFDSGRNKLAVLANPVIEGAFVFVSANGNELSKEVVAFRI